MQNQKTTPIEDQEIDIESLLAELTQGQYLFTLGLIDPDTTDHDAYKIAYPNQNMSKASLSVEICKLKNHPKISLILKAARMQGLGQALEDRAEHIKRLRELSIKAELSGNLGAAVNAEVNAGKVSGHYIERHENVNETRKQELEERMELLTGKDKTDTSEIVH
jgi:hypothetical protein